MRVRPRCALNLLAAGIVSAGVIYASFFGAGPLPALGPAFNPTTGAWTMALDASINNETLHLAGLRQPVTITLEKDGTAHVVANTDHDLFLAVGSSLVVWPAAGFPLMAKRNGARLAIINREATEFDAISDLVVRADIGTVLAPLITH